MKIDIIGDIHGELEALINLGRHLGYDTLRDWDHPDGRRLIFVGDLIDRGPRSLEVATLVHALVKQGRALCLMGNHEFNIIEWHRGRQSPKSSNLDTISQIALNSDPWRPVLEFFETLPIAVQLPDLRITHAAWHSDCFTQLSPVLATSPNVALIDPFWDTFIALHSPYQKGGTFRKGLSLKNFPGQDESPLGIFIKGYETPTDTPFLDNDGKLRRVIRTPWWQPEFSEVPRDVRLVFGHYWNMPPHEPNMAFVPPYPSGHPESRTWYHSQANIPQYGQIPLDAHTTAICIDYNGITKEGSRACVGAYRYPESAVAWACADS